MINAKHDDPTSFKLEKYIKESDYFIGFPDEEKEYKEKTKQQYSKTHNGKTMAEEMIENKKYI